MDEAKLEELPRARKSEELARFKDAVALAHAACMEDKPFNPQALGFVWTEDQIADVAIATAHRQEARSRADVSMITQNDLPK